MEAGSHRARRRGHRADRRLSERKPNGRRRGGQLRAAARPQGDGGGSAAGFEPIHPRRELHQRELEGWVCVCFPVSRTLWNPSTSAPTSISADKGLSSGVFIEVVSKAGTNDYHGSLAWWHTNNRMRARSIVDTELPSLPPQRDLGDAWVDPSSGTRHSSLSGLDVLRSSQTQSAVGTVETPEFVNFVKSAFPGSMAAEIFDLQAPAVSASANIQTIGEIKSSLPGQFPDEMFPDDLPAVGTTFVTSSAPRNGEQVTLRGDHHFNDVKDRLFGYYYRSTSDTSLNSHAHF